MTTLIYREGVLTGDRRYGIPLVDDTIVYVDRPKVHLHPSNKIAFGICGSTKGKGVVEALGDYLLTVAMLIESGNIPDMKEVLNDWAVKDLTIILMTRQNAWLILYKDEKVKFTNLDDLPYYAVGSGQWAAVALLGEGCSVKQLYDIISKVDGGTGQKFDMYKKTKLIGLRSKRARSHL